MRDDATKLLRLLLAQDGPLTAKRLSERLGLSVRSVKYRVAELNREGERLVGGAPIRSSHSGYAAVRDLARALLQQIDGTPSPRTRAEREHYIIKRFALGNADGVSMFDLCDELHVSYSTLRGIVSHLNERFVSFKVSFVVEHDVLYFSGSERDKRSLISSALFEETGSGVMDASVLKDSFPEAAVESVSGILDEGLRAHHYSINEFARVVFLLHLLVTVSRIRNGQSITDGSSLEATGDPQEALMADVCDRLENAFSIQINPRERAGIYLLFKSFTGTEMESSTEAACRIVDEKIFELAYSITSRINELYLIDLRDDSFLVPFALHLSTLLFRQRAGAHISNPLSFTFKYDCPIIYDVAVSISIMLREQLSLQINDDETTFIALHVGAEVERQKTTADKVSCVILCPSYHGMAEALRNRIQANFSTQLTIVQVVSYEHQIGRLKFDLLITSMPVHTVGAFETVQVTPYAKDLNYAAINSAITRLVQRRHNQVLHDNFGRFFRSELFFSPAPEARDEFELIALLADRLMREGCVREGFRENVLARERAASTAFGGVAIPHSVAGDDVVRTSIAVAISDKGIRWGGSIVHVAFLIAIGDDARETFKSVYESLFGLFTDASLVDRAREASSFDEFARFIRSCTETGA